MSSIFLSYVRDDVDKARSLASAIERAGHSVWWDRHIQGGAQYSAEIEEALRAASKVVVLWSAKAVVSAWVRDEAAFARDNGRLIPASLDGTEPPLGFRQFQTIDLSRWRGRSTALQLSALLEAIDAPASKMQHFKTDDPNLGPLSIGFLRSRWPIVAALAIFALMIGGGWWWSTTLSAHVPIVAIHAADNSAASAEVARDLAVRLGDLQSARSDAFQLVSGAQSADLELQVAAGGIDEKLRRDITVLSGENRSILWSTALEQPTTKANDLSQQLIVTSKRVIFCAIEALSDRRDRIDPSTLKTYLSGCSSFDNAVSGTDYDPNVDKLFEQVVAEAPHFKGAWAKLLATETQGVFDPDPPRSLIDSLRVHIAQAERLGLDVGEIYAAKAVLRPVSDFLGMFPLIDQGLNTDPNNPALHLLRATLLMDVGRMSEAVDEANAASQLDPLSPGGRDLYISALALAGRTESAYAELRKAEAIWPGAQNIQSLRYRLDLRFGDPKEALEAYQALNAGNAMPQSKAFLEARIDPTPANIDKAIDEERAISAGQPDLIAGLAQALGQFGRKDEIINLLLHYPDPDDIRYQAVLFRPAFRDMWRDPRSIGAAAHLGFLRFWVKSGQWPDFCFDPTLPYNCKKEAAKYRV